MTEDSPQFMREDSPQVMAEGTVDDDIAMLSAHLPRGNQTLELQVQTEWQQEELCVSGYSSAGLMTDTLPTPYRQNNTDMNVASLRHLCVAVSTVHGEHQRWEAAYRVCHGKTWLIYKHSVQLPEIWPRGVQKLPAERVNMFRFLLLERKPLKCAINLAKRSQNI